MAAGNNRARGMGRAPSQDDLDFLHKRIDALQRELEALRNSRTPTVPIYDSTNFPAKAVEGQVVIAPIV